MAHGENYVTNQRLRRDNKMFRNVHAEAHVLDRLKSSRKINGPCKIQLYIIRLSKNSTNDDYQLKNSHPCADCLYKICQESFYHITHVCYSDSNGNMVSEKITDMIQRPQYVCQAHRMVTVPKYLRKTFHLTNI